MPMPTLTMTKREVWRTDDGYHCILETRLTPEGAMFRSVIREKMPYGEAAGHVRKWYEGRLT